MSFSLYIIFAAVSFLASVAGAICGIGGGVLIKPILDMFGVLSVASISFLSGCTVLSMSCYSVVKARLSGSSLVDMRTGTPLAIGAALGGIGGKMMFQYISGLVEDKNQVGAVQAACLLIITLGTLIYTLKKDRIKTRQVSNVWVCINLVVLFYFFSMDTKTAAQNSLYIILFSQIASLVNTLATGSVPEFGIGLLVIMVGCGILGGAAGRVVNRRMDGEMVNKLFVGLMAAIMMICGYNIVKFM